MPTFSPGVTKTAIATISNPTARGFNYSAELYLGLPKKASSGKVSFSLAAGETKPIRFTVMMPSTAGTYPVYLDVFVDSQPVGLYESREGEEVVIAAAEVTLQTTLYFDALEGAWLALAEGATVHFYGELRLYTGYLNPYWLSYTCYAEFIVITPSGARKTARTSSVVMYYSAGVFDPVEIYSYEQGKYTVTVNLYANGILQDTRTFTVNDVWI